MRGPSKGRPWLRLAIASLAVIAVVAAAVAVRSATARGCSSTGAQAVAPPAGSTAQQVTQAFVAAVNARDIVLAQELTWQPVRADVWATAASGAEGKFSVLCSFPRTAVTSVEIDGVDGLESQTVYGTFVFTASPAGGLTDDFPRNDSGEFLAGSIQLRRDAATNEWRVAALDPGPRTDQFT